MSRPSLGPDVSRVREEDGSGRVREVVRRGPEVGLGRGARVLVLVGREARGGAGSE